MNDLPWLKLYAQDWMIDPNIGDLSSEDRICYLTMMCMAHLSKKRGTISDFSEEKIIRESKFKTREEADRAVGFSERMKNMLRWHGSSVSLPNFKKRQEGNLSGYERVKKYRDKLKRNDNASDTRKITLDTNRELDKEEDIKHTSFEKFWNIYPKKIAKQKAFSSWKKIPASEHEVIYSDLGRKVRSDQWLKDNGQYIPNPATYLNQERWKDQVELPKAAPPPKICLACKKDAKSGWAEVKGGILCSDCFGKPSGSEKLKDMKLGVIKSTIPN